MTMPCQPPSRRHAAVLPAALLLAGALSGCAGGGSDYPSLASRPAERLTDTVQSPDSHKPAGNVSNIPGTPSPDLAARLGQLVEQGRSARRDFGDKQAGAQKLVGAAGTAPVGSEAWARATQALSGIESARSLTAQPLIDLDRLEIDDRLAHPAVPNQAPRPDAVAIAQARDTVAALVAAEDGILAKLNGRLGR